MVAPGSFVAQRVLGQLELLGVLPDVAKVADSLTREENREGRERKGGKGRVKGGRGTGDNREGEEREGGWERVPGRPPAH